MNNTQRTIYFVGAAVGIIQISVSNALDISFWADSIIWVIIYVVGMYAVDLWLRRNDD